MKLIKRELVESTVEATLFNYHLAALVGAEHVVGGGLGFVLMLDRKGRVFVYDELLIGPDRRAGNRSRMVFRSCSLRRRSSQYHPFSILHSETTSCRTGGGG